jgi:predicted GNAT family N-acyltransferase
MNDSTYTVIRVDWPQAEHDIRQVRDAVFVHEMGIPAELEWDGADEHSLHVLARAEDATAIGTGRLLPSGQIGRMAVLKPWRGRGIGSAMLEALLAAAREARMTEMWLHAQHTVVEFYRESGFTAVGSSFLSAGIPHQKMVLTLE